MEQKKSRSELFSPRWLRVISTVGLRSMLCRRWSRGITWKTTMDWQLTFTIRTRINSMPRNISTFKTARQVRVTFGDLINPIIFHSWLVLSEFIVNISIAKTEKFKRQRCQVTPTQQVRILENSSELYFEAFTFRETRNDAILFLPDKWTKTFFCASSKMIHGMPEMCSQSCVKSLERPKTLTVAICRRCLAIQ